MNDPTPTDYGSLKREIEQALEEADHIRARRLLAEAWRGDPGPARAGFVLSRAERVEGGASSGACRVALLRSFTVEPLVPLLRASAWVGGVPLEVHVGPFGAWAQEILDPESALYQFGPDIAVLAVQARDIAPDLWERFAELSAEEVEAAIDRVAGEYGSVIEAFRHHSRASLIVHTLELPPAPRQGVLDAQLATGQNAAIEAVNSRLLELAAEQTGVYLLDYDGLVARHGRLAWHEPRKWLTTRLPIAPDCLMHLVQEWLRFIYPLTGRSCKALVLDLDNTLWGGVVGEDGVEGLTLGLEYPGAAFRDLQRVALDLFHRGILLAVCSKNNEDDAMEAFDGHPGMLLEREHIAAWRVDWTDKATNLRQIAEELNIGLSELAFLDDNPTERHWIREQLPEVHVIELPADPFEYAEAVSNVFVVERCEPQVTNTRRTEVVHRDANVVVLLRDVQRRERRYRPSQ
ncbi:MAG: HAD-IIIC family phosphatase, partial [Gemmatimonadetes bacterium]|nr:HAD-IIIC family phosphatase [Gemmatimonadota bacterium]